MEPIKYEEVEARLLTIREQRVLLDSDVAALYGVETKRINEAVRNNPARFPSGYVCELSEKEKNELVENFDRFHRLKHSTARPKAFTEKGLYMLATILKSRKAVQTTLAIIEIFTKVRALRKAAGDLSTASTTDQKKALLEKSGKIVTEVLGDELVADNCETTIELNFAVLKLKHKVMKKKGDDTKMR